MRQASSVSNFSQYRPASGRQSTTKLHQQKLPTHVFNLH